MSSAALAAALALVEYRMAVAARDARCAVSIFGRVGDAEVRLRGRLASAYGRHASAGSGRSRDGHMAGSGHGVSVPRQRSLFPV
jgi:hypothetical protein